MAVEAGSSMGMVQVRVSLENAAAQNGGAAPGILSLAGGVLKEPRVSGHVQAIAEQSVDRSREFYLQSSTVAWGGAKVATEVAEAAWSSVKLLSEKINQNVSANTAAVFDAAKVFSRAMSLMEIVSLQDQFLRSFFATASAQTEEFYDLSMRASQHVLETAHAATNRSAAGDL
jgi:hypothetical protein